MTDLQWLRAFAQDVLSHRRLDIDDLEELALKHGLMEKREVTEPCADCLCAEAGVEFPTKCNFQTPLLRGDGDD